MCVLCVCLFVCWLFGWLVVVVVFLGGFGGEGMGCVFVVVVLWWLLLLLLFLFLGDCCFVFAFACCFLPPAGVFVICSLPMPSSGRVWMGAECGRCGILNVDVDVGVWALSWP